MTTEEMESERLDRLTGLVERVTFHNPENGFAILKVKVPGEKELVTVVGNVAAVNPGEYLSGLGTWVQDRSYGRQFKTSFVNLSHPNTLDGMEKYLGSGVVKGIGQHFAKKLIKKFGERVFEVIEQEPEKLRGIEGIGDKRIEMITSAWNDQKKIREIMVFLQSHGVGTARAVRIYKTYGDQSIEVLEENPYRLALDIVGVGFKTADQLAMKLGVEPNSLIRARAGIHHVLQDMSSQGHCGVYFEELIKISVELLEIPEDIIDLAITEEVDAEHLIEEQFSERRLLSLKSLYLAEVGVAKNIIRLNSGSPFWGDVDVDKAIPWVEQKNKIKLSASQKTAITTSIQSKVSVITGGPGVGKTTVVNSILKIIRSKGASVTLCAPTGRAAKRLTESTGLSAKTIHRLLEFDPGTRKFKYHEDNPIEADLVVVDEASMIDIVLMHHLLKAISSHCALIIVGDVDQLPSVGPGAVLADIIRSECVNTVRLTEIFRQAATSQIIVNAHRVNSGQTPVVEPEAKKLTDFYFIEAKTPEEIHSKTLKVMTERIPERFKLDPIRDVQLLTPMHRGDIGVRGMNEDLQKLLNGAAEPKVLRYGTTYSMGDKVMQITNNYDKDVFNGDIGFIKSMDLDEKALTVDFDDRVVEYYFDELDELVLAYACTIHKSQGSEYPAVVIPVATQHYMMLQRNLLYTGITRGKKLVVLIGQKQAIALAVKNTKANMRVTQLAFRINEINRLA